MIPCDEKLSESLKKRYSHLHPLVLQRSIERAENLSELFDILESVPKKPPFSWDEGSRAWIKETDIAAKKQLKKMISKET